MASAFNQLSFGAILAESGMQVPEEQLASLLVGYRHLRHLIDLLDRPTTFEAEPAVTFAIEKQ
jgi:hypothetical protein